LNDQEAYQYITTRISVTRQKIVLAKSFIFDSVREVVDAENLIIRFCEHMDAVLPTMVVLTPPIDPIPILDKAADSISWRQAACEAIWELIHLNRLIPRSASLAERTPSIGYTIGGYSSGWRFDQYPISVPSKLARPWSLAYSEQPLANHDLYIHEIGIENIHPQVESALREAVKCFRYELYTACLAMLGKASEGAWLDLGSSLLSIVPSMDQTKVDKHRNDLENSHVSTSKKIDQIISLFIRQDIAPLKQVAEQSQYKQQDLRSAQIWSETVSGSRNTIHFGVKPAMTNTYEKVAALLIGAVPYFKILYAIKRAADEMSGGVPQSSL
jgi:hypothetical protein